MKFGVPWKVKGTRPDAADTAQDAVRRSAMSAGDSHPDLGHSREALARLDRRVDEFVSNARATPAFALGAEPSTTATAKAGWAGLDRAIAEITARQQALDAEADALPLEDVAPAAPTPNSPGFEQPLRHSGTQTRHRPDVLEEAIAGLRGTLDEIARSLNEAMPRRAIEALEIQVRALAARLDGGENSAGDTTTLAAVEQGLAEVRDALRALTPAEKLAGFQEVARTISQKIDLLSSGSHNPAAFQQLEAAISALRGIVSHVASNESLALLAAEVHGLAQKIDQIASAGALDILEKRIAHVADAVEARSLDTGSVSPQLEAMVKALNDRIGEIQLTRGDEKAIGKLEDRIVNLVEKLDASAARFSQFEAIERGLADLLVSMEGQRAGDVAASPAVQTPSPIDGLQRDIARNQTSLEAVHGTLGHVVDRLAMIETEMREAPRPPSPPPQAAPLPMPSRAAPLNPPSRATAAAQAAAAMARANPPAPRQPIDPNLPPDHPIEPGSGTNPGRLSASPADRIAASEADLDQAKPPVIPDPGEKSNFIAAARRAAQAAAADPSPSALRAVADHQEQAEQTLAAKLAKRVRSIFVGASVILLVGGALRIAADFVESNHAPVIAGAHAPGAEAKRAAAQTEAPSIPENTKTAESSAALQSIPAAASVIPVPELNPPEVTGTVDSKPRPSPPQSQPKPALPAIRKPPNADQLPAAIAGPALRSAAAAGMAAAEYEIGIRYAEGRGVPANSQEAALWLELAAKRGLAPAQLRLAGLYEKGIGVKKDIETARRLYKAAAEQGNAQAMHNLAVLYAEGAAVKPDYRTAAQWFRLASDHGISDSQYNLAILYARGIGVEQNLAESYKWFSLAAAQDDREAASKRDEVGKRLDPHSLTAARLAAEAFRPQPQPAPATSVNPPAGGWDAATSSRLDPAPEARPKPRAAGPIRLGAQ
jgi:localization factor PodJL